MDVRAMSPDLTIENYWACEAYVEYVRTGARLRKMLEMKKPACQWNQYNDGKEPVNGKCPCCGGSLTVLKYGV